MKSNSTVQILKSVGRVFKDSMNIENMHDKINVLNSKKKVPLSDSINDSFSEEYESSNIEYNEDFSNDNNESIEQTETMEMQKENSTNSLGVMDSIVQELTSVRLQQAIILSEIVGKPRSKTRKRRRF